jgi:FdrA protein
MLQQVGVRVFRETEDAVSYVVSRLRTNVSNVFAPLALGDFSGDFAGINVGVESFYASLKGQGVPAVHVDWRPPAGGNEKLMAILAKMRSK